MASGRQPSALIEREAELTELRAAAERAEAGTGAVLLIQGERGIGKTALLGAARELAAERGFRVLEARGSAIETEFPWGAVLQAFSPLVRELDPELLFAGAAAQARGLLERADPVAPSAAPPDRWPHLHGLYWLLVNLSDQQPVLITVDDLQLVDEPSAQLVAFLLQRVAEHPILLVASLRADEQLGPSATVIAEASATTTRPGRLTEDAVAAIAEEAGTSLGDDELRDLIRASDGVPLYVNQLLAALEHSSERAGDLWAELLGDHLRGRAGRLGKEVLALVEVVAVLESGSRDVAFELAQLDPSGGLEALQKAAKAAILEGGDGGEVRFAHPSMREAIYEQLPPARLESLHAAAARLLDSLGADPLTASAHLLRTGPIDEPWAARALMRAAAGAGSDSPEGTVGLLERAVREPALRSDGAAHLALGRARLAAGLEAGAALERAVDLSPAGPQRAAARGMLGYEWVMRGRQQAAIDELAASQEEIAAAGEELGRALDSELTLNWFLVTRWVRGIGAESMRAIRESAPPGPPAPGRLAAIGADDTLLGKRESAREPLLAAQAEQPEGLVAQIATHALSTLGEFELAEQISDRQLAAARERGELLGTVRALDARVYLNWIRGEVAALLADSELELELTDQRWDVTTVGVRATRAEALLAAGHPEEAEATIDLPSEIVAALPDSWTWGWHPYGQAVVAFAKGSWERAREQAAEAGERLLATNAPSVDFMPWRPLEARALFRMGEIERARLAAEALLEVSTEQGSRRGRGQALALLGEIEGEAGLERWAEGAELLIAEGTQLMAIVELLGLGRALRQARHPREARDPLSRAVDLAVKVGATALATEGSEELRAAGAKPRRPQRTGVAALTPSEERVCRMVAEGASNREVAERLFITVRTVESHLTASYRKLGVGDRSELAAALASD